MEWIFEAINKTDNLFISKGIKKSNSLYSNAILVGNVIMRSIAVIFGQNV